MSASAKKKLRKEENAAQLTEKQLKEQKEAKKLKLYTTIFIVAIAVILVAGLVIAGTNFYKNSGIREKNSVAAVIGDHEINGVEMSYYYTDTIDNNYNSWYSTYGDSMSLYMSLMGLDLSLPLSEQTYSDGTTWADYFVDVALSAAQRDYLLADKAEAEGFTITEETKQTLEQSFANLPAFATISGYANVDNYLHAIYGPGASEETYRAYAERSALASDFYNAYSESLVIDDAAIRAYEADKYDEFSSFSYANYTISYSHYLTGGTEDENGNVTYTEEENEAARAAAKDAAESLPECSTVEELNAAIAALPANENASDECTEYSDILYTSANSNIRDWLAASDRKVGDFTVVANESTITDEDGVESTVVNGYSVYLFTGRDDNTRPLANVRHILVNFEGGTTDENGNTTYSDEEKAAALEEAENLLTLYEMGEQTEEAFADLATANTDDTGSAETGGLYEDIAPVQGVYVESFTNWATDPAREAGDTGIIESTYGYHVMYYVGDDEMTYRDSMIFDEIQSETISTWYDGILSTGKVEEKDTSYLNKDIVLAQ
ncbi:MAG: peptidylprolyl isomerase [Oscillospiraceae bacterium]|nr:peptidylprolyl isomerase [Oscillospiraceae bacterium]